MEDLNPKQELFCQYYTKNDELFGNATLAYAEAYGYDFDVLSEEKPVTKTDDKGKPIEWGFSERELAYNVCSVQGSKHLRIPKINDRVVMLLNELLKDDVVDSELARVIKQNHKLDAKVAAIKEYNKLRQRIVDKADITSKGEQIATTTGAEIEEIAKRVGEELRLKKLQ